MSSSELKAEANSKVVEPLLPIEKKLISFSLGLGIGKGAHICGTHVQEMCRIGGAISETVADRRIPFYQGHLDVSENRRSRWQASRTPLRLRPR